MMRSAIIASFSLSSSPSMNSSALNIESSVNSAMFIPPTVTASAVFLSLRPLHSGQFTSDMHSSISARIAGLCVSR